jgi:hypothetical protein
LCVCIGEICGKKQILDSDVAFGVSEIKNDWIWGSKIMSLWRKEIILGN